MSKYSQDASSVPYTSFGRFPKSKASWSSTTVDALDMPCWSKSPVARSSVSANNSNPVVGLSKSNMLTELFGATSYALEFGCSLALYHKSLQFKACKTLTFSALAHRTIQLCNGHRGGIMLSYT